MWREIIKKEKIHAVWIQPSGSIRIEPTDKEDIEIFIKGKKSKKVKLETSITEGKLEIFFYIDPAVVDQVQPLELEIRLPPIPYVSIYAGWGPIQDRSFWIGEIRAQHLDVITTYPQETVSCKAQCKSISIRANNVKIESQKAGIIIFDKD